MLLHELFGMTKLVICNQQQPFIGTE